MIAKTVKRIKIKLLVIIEVSTQAKIIKKLEKIKSNQRF